MSLNSTLRPWRGLWIIFSSCFIKALFSNQRKWHTRASSHEYDADISSCVCLPVGHDAAKRPRIWIFILMYIMLSRIKMWPADLILEPWGFAWQYKTSWNSKRRNNPCQLCAPRRKEKRRQFLTADARKQITGLVFKKYKKNMELPEKLNIQKILSLGDIFKFHGRKNDLQMSFSDD